MSNNIIFLDIDGVLNNVETRFRAFVPECIAALNRITDTTDAELVISSTWRYIFGVEKTAQRLHEAGATGEVIGGTPGVNEKQGEIYIGIDRVTAIRSWLTANPDVTSYVAIDDDPSILELGEHHAVLTDPTTGLTEAEAEQAIEKLGITN